MKDMLIIAIKIMSRFSQMIESSNKLLKKIFMEKLNQKSKIKKTFKKKFNQKYKKKVLLLCY